MNIEVLPGLGVLVGSLVAVSVSAGTEVADSVVAEESTVEESSDEVSVLVEVSDVVSELSDESIVASVLVAELVSMDSIDGMMSASELIRMLATNTIKIAHKQIIMRLTPAIIKILPFFVFKNS